MEFGVVVPQLLVVPEVLQLVSETMQPVAETGSVETGDVEAGLVEAGGVETGLFDDGAVESVRDATPLGVLITLVALSYLGSATFVTPAAVLLHWVKRQQWTLTWVGILLGSYVLRSLVKTHNSLSRPAVEPPVDPAAFPSLLAPLYAHPAEISTTSFPSGHTMTAVIFWALFVFDTDVGSRRLRVGIATPIVFAVAHSRIAVGAHYAGDVVGGVLLGVFFLAAMLQLRSYFENPAGPLFAVAGGLAAAVLVSSRSFTAEVTLGVATAVLALLYGRPLVEWVDRSLPAGWASPDRVTAGTNLDRMAVSADGRERTAAIGAIGVVVVTVLAGGLTYQGHVLAQFSVGLLAGLVIVGVPRLVEAVARTDISVPFGQRFST